VTAIQTELERIFERSATKWVTKTDLSHLAYVVSGEQQEVMRAAGYEPVSETKKRIIHIQSAEGVLETSYYESLRTGSDRSPEVRMGRGLLHWLDQGDELTLATDGKQVFAFKNLSGHRESSPGEPEEDSLDPLYKQLNDRKLLKIARAAKKKPRKRTVTTTQFDRDPAVRELVNRRCRGHCESPGCKYIGFEKDNGEAFIEEHHITFLSEGGEDTIENTAGICPNCHRFAHHGRKRDVFADALRKAVASANKKMLSVIEFG
jgi:hypothetical protein